MFCNKFREKAEREPYDHEVKMIIFVHQYFLFCILLHAAESLGPSGWLGEWSFNQLIFKYCVDIINIEYPFQYNLELKHFECIVKLADGRYWEWLIWLFDRII